MRIFIVSFLLCSFCSAQTDHFYTIGFHTAPRDLSALVVNSVNYRELPGSPYPFQTSSFDVFFSFNNTLPIEGPGRLLYATRQDPDQIYGYRRLADGQLDPLPGFPIDLQATPTDSYGIVWFVKHPILPVVYSCNVWKDHISIYHIQEDGGLEELAESPFHLAPTAPGPQGLAFSPDGEFAFLNTFEVEGMFTMAVDGETGMLSDLQHETILGGDRGRGVVLTPDGRYLYATVRNGMQIFGFRVDGRRLTPLEGFPWEPGVDTVWLQIQGRFMAIGGALIRKVGIALIGENGSLAFAEGSPRDVYSHSMFYSAFSPRNDRVLFGGDSLIHAFDLDFEGRMTSAPKSPTFLDGIYSGVSAAPEITGDPFSLYFSPSPEPGDPSIRIEGDPNTPFYLQNGDDCSGPYVTNEDGVIMLPVPVTTDQRFKLKAYCDEVYSADVVQTVPTLSSVGFLVFISTLVFTGLFFQRKKEQT